MNNEINNAHVIVYRASCYKFWQREWIKGFATDTQLKRALDRLKNEQTYGKGV